MFAALRRPPAESGLAALAAWADAGRPEYEVVAQRRDADGPMIDRALEIVRRFIVERGLIIFGGLAIDYALRLKGARIYPDDERPDFDFLSPRSVDDAYDLADLLRGAGFEAVGAIRGIHVQTMRVRTGFVSVADIGYAPPDVFARIPTLEVQGLRFAHPDFQRMDMHLAFCYPFNSPPTEDIYHRWRKDLKRFNLFELHYPVSPPAGAPAAPLALVRAEFAVAVVGRPGGLTVALQGFAAFALLRRALDEAADALGLPRPDVAAPRLAVSFPDERTVEAEVAAGAALHAMCSDPAAATAGAAGARWTDPYMDIAPEAVRAGPLVVYSTADRLLAATPVRAGAGPGAGSGAVLVVTPQALLLHFLYEAHRADGAERSAYTAFYAHTLEIVRAAEGLFARAAAEAPGQRDAILRAFSESPFAPTVRTVGVANRSAAYVIKMAALAERLREEPPSGLGLPPGLAGLLAGLPPNYYPGGGKSRPPPYDYTQCAFFRRSGGDRLAPAEKAESAKRAEQAEQAEEAELVEEADPAEEAAERPPKAAKK